MKCVNCEGSGSVKGNPDYVATCQSCYGDGELDWIDSIYGRHHKARKSGLRTLKAGWTIETKQDLNALYDSDMMNQLSNIASDEIAKKIDDSILDALSFKIETRKV